MKNEHFERYIGELSPELQEKARQCKNMQELNALIAENDVELSEDALEAVAGGCSTSSEKYNQGDLFGQICPECFTELRYWDKCYNEKPGYTYIWRLYCDNPKCSSYNKLWFVGDPEYDHSPKRY